MATDDCNGRFHSNMFSRNHCVTKSVTYLYTASPSMQLANSMHQGEPQNVCLQGGDLGYFLSFSLARKVHLATRLFLIWRKSFKKFLFESQPKITFISGCKLFTA